MVPQGGGYAGSSGGWKFYWRRPSSCVVILPPPSFCSLRNGDWSDKSPLWTPELREELQVVSDPEDGTFWMAFEDFVQHFDSMNVNR